MLCLCERIPLMQHLYGWLACDGEHANVIPAPEEAPGNMGVSQDVRKRGIVRSGLLHRVSMGGRSSFPGAIERIGAIAIANFRDEQRLIEGCGQCIQLRPDLLLPERGHGCRVETCGGVE